MDDFLKSAIEFANGPAAVAALFKIRSQAVSQWTICPTDRVLGLCEAGGWRVIPHQLRRDIYPNPTDGLPASQSEAA